MSIIRVGPSLLAACALLVACNEKQEQFVYSLDGKPAGAPTAQAPAAAPETPAAPAAATTATGALPPSGDPAKHVDPEFYLPADSELTTTPSGLKYLMIREGSGTPPTLGSTFNAHYCGWLTDGTKFDSSYESGQPLSYPVNRMIKGWQEALVMMKPGAEYILVVPSSIGYGDAGMPPVIPAKATLVFRMELLSAGG
jgi:hypothetical protein